MQQQSARLELLKAARRVADFASAQGVPPSYNMRRSTYEHAGALIADAVLQAGLNYQSVVLPRIRRMITNYPDADCISVLVYFVEKGITSDLLDWKHSTKVTRFERIVEFLNNASVETIADMRVLLASDDFCSQLRTINGVGFKTVDYMACLAGIESVAVDRHIRRFAVRAGVDRNEYNFLKYTFCFAADLLSIPRREFDAWVWSCEAGKRPSQLKLAF